VFNTVFPSLHHTTIVRISRKMIYLHNHSSGGESCWLEAVKRIDEISFPALGVSCKGSSLRAAIEGCLYYGVSCKGSSLRAAIEGCLYYKEIISPKSGATSNMTSFRIFNSSTINAVSVNT